MLPTVAFSKTEGLEVSPFRPACSISLFRPPLTRNPQPRLSNHGDWPQASRCWSGSWMCLPSGKRAPDWLPPQLWPRKAPQSSQPIGRRRGSGLGIYASGAVDHALAGVMRDCV